MTGTAMNTRRVTVNTTVMTVGRRMGGGGPMDSGRIAVMVVVMTIRAMAVVVTGAAAITEPVSRTGCSNRRGVCCAGRHQNFT